MARGTLTTPSQRERVYNALREGKSRSEAARAGGVSYDTVKRMAVDFGFSQDTAKKRRNLTKLELGPEGIEAPQPLRAHELSPEAARALQDFEYFRRRYFGHLSTPWQLETAALLVDLLETDQKEYVVENCPPGTGKTTLIHDIAAWVICRNRAIRGLFGSRTMNNATRQLMRLRRSLERTIPLKAKAGDLQAGVAIDADSTLALDYGRFRPEKEEVWRADAFVVFQSDDIPITEKEPTWSAYGMDAGVLGNRFEVILWDDLVDRKTTRSLSVAQDLYKLWDEELETRLEPKGLLVLLGQRMAANDLYRYCLDKKFGEKTEEDEDEVDATEKEAMYRHVCFKAHYEENCTGYHKNSKPFPQGCLLDPYRLPMRELNHIKANSPDRFRVLYQQEDIDLDAVLVDMVWIQGGTDRDGVQCMGCWDRDRGTWELPRGLTRPYLAYVSADPSPSKYWAIECWVYHPATQQRFLLDLVRQRMDAPDLLDWNYSIGCFTGILEDWWLKSQELGCPFKSLIVEVNAAQKFLLQYDHVKRWSSLHGVNIIPHTTGINKSSPELGVPTLAPHYKFGRVRLPGKDSQARVASLKLIDEVTRWPEGRTDDCVMAQWFGEANIYRMYNPAADKPITLWRPSWLKKDVNRIRV